jgi:hypothetical protein
LLAAFTSILYHITIKKAIGKKDALFLKDRQQKGGIVTDENILGILSVFA